tara:strand:+ start:303 stop:1430 length:1128 start_codon:yes stop_codon:yes gene_type:complete
MLRFLPAAVLALSLLCTQSAFSESAARRMAPLMPRAAESLLLDIAAAGDRLIATGEYGHVLYSDNAGQHWQQARVPTTQMLTAVHFVNATTGWAVGHDGLVLVSEDAGANWRIQRDGLAVQHQLNIEQREVAHRRLRALQAQQRAAREQPDAAFEAALDDARMDLEDAALTLEEPVFTEPLLDVWFEDGNRGWAVGAFGTFIGTTDGGQHWSDHSERLDNPDEFHLNAIIGDGEGQVFIAGEGGLMFRSGNSGATWESLEPFYDGSWFGLVFEPVSRALLVFGLRGNLFRSPDFGRSFERVPVDTHISLAGGGADKSGRVVITGGVGTVLYSAGGARQFRRSMLEDGLSLSSGIPRNGRLVLVGQGGARVYEVQP